MLARFPKGRVMLPAVVSLAVAMTLPASPGAAAPKVRCKPGQVPVISGTASNPKLALKKGKPRCQAEPKLKSSKIEPAASTPQGSVSSTADQITQALAAKPEALKKAEKKLGKKATGSLVARSLNDWRSGAQAQARRLADDGGFHYAGSFGDAAKGTAGSAKIDAGAANADGSGVKATATIEFSADSKGLKDLGADKITSGKSAKVRLDIAFEDAPAVCPTAAGRVDGKLNASAKLTLTIDGQATTVSAKVEAKYFITVGGDARWKTIDGVDVMTTFSYSAPGEATSTWRGERAGAGFTEKGIFGEGSGDIESAIKEQRSHIRDDLGGVWGPKGRVLYSDPSTDNIFNYGGSISHLKGMILTEVATQYLTFAAVEYIRKVVAPRGQKHWYDDEACLKIDGAPNKANLGPGEQATVTTKNAKAFDGTPAAVSQTASGVASFTPAGADMQPGGSTDFTLTAPSSRPVVATWKVVALSPAGKKTLNGTLGEQPTYTVILDDHETANYATWTSKANMYGKVDTKAVDGSNPFQSTGTGPLTWSNYSNVVHVEYTTMHDPVPGNGSFTPLVTSNGDGTVKVEIDVSAGAKVLWTVTNDEPPEPGGDDPPAVDVPGSAGTIAIALWSDPITFTLPSTGGTYAFSKEFTTGDGGTTSVGTVTLVPGASS